MLGLPFPLLRCHLALLTSIKPFSYYRELLEFSGYVEPEGISNLDVLRYTSFSLTRITLLSSSKEIAIMINFAPNCTFPMTKPTGFIRSPNIRSTTDIIWGCISVIVLRLGRFFTLRSLRRLKQDPMIHQFKFSGDRCIIWGEN